MVAVVTAAWGGGEGGMEGGRGGGGHVMNSCHCDGVVGLMNGISTLNSCRGVWDGAEER